MSARRIIIDFDGPRRIWSLPDFLPKVINPVDTLVIRTACNLKSSFVGFESVILFIFDVCISKIRQGGDLASNRHMKE